MKNPISRKALSILLAFSMIFSIFQLAGVAAFAEGSSSDNVIDSGYCGVKDSLRWALTKDDTDSTKYTLTISGSGNMSDYSGGGSPWYSYCNQITKLVLEEGITSIGNRAFQDCQKITGDLKIPNGVTSIGREAFENCFSLRGSLKIPDSVTNIGYGAFWSCHFTGSLIIPNSVASIEDRAFYSSGFTGSLEIPDSVTSIGDWAFQHCGFTGSLEIPNSVTSIEHGAFCNCTGFTGSLTIPDSVTSINGWAFDGCAGFTKAIIPMSVTNIGVDTFDAWKSDSTIYNLSNIAMTEGTHYSGAKLGTVYAVTTHVGNHETDYKAAGDSDFPFTLTPPTKENYAFAGWYTDSHFENAWTGNGKSVTSNLTLYAKFKQILSVSDIACVKNRGLTVYDGKTKEIPVTVTLSGYSSDGGTPTVETATATAAVSSPSAGTYTSYTLSGIELPQNSSYSLTGATPQFTITAGKINDFGVTIMKAKNVIAIVDKTLRKTYGDAPFALAGISNTANDKMGYASNNVYAATVDGIGNVTITGVGTAVITVSAPETENYKAAENQMVTVTITSSSGGSSATNSSPSLPSSVTDTPTGFSADLSSATMPTGVTRVSLSATQPMQGGASGSEASRALHLAVSDAKLNVIGTPVFYDLKLLDQNGNPLTGFGGRVTVRLPLPAGVRGTPHVLRYEESTGTFSDMNATLENGFLVFSTDHFSYYAVAGVGDSIMLDTKSFQMPVDGKYQIGVKLTGSKAAAVKVYSTNDKVAVAVKLANGNYQVTGTGFGTAYIMYDVYDDKSNRLTHASVRVDVKTGIRPRGNSTRQIGVF